MLPINISSENPSCGLVMSATVCYSTTGSGDPNWISGVVLKRRNAKSGVELTALLGVVAVVAMLLLSLLVFLAWRHWFRSRRVCDKARFRRYSLQEIKQMTGDFKTVLGRGSYSTVYLGKSGDTSYAVKVFERDCKHFEMEFMLLEKIHHKSVVDCYGYCASKGKVMLVLEYMLNGSLQHQLHKLGGRDLDPQKRLQIAKDLAAGLCYLHHEIKPFIIHRDVKPSNVLLDHKHRAKLADFGTCRPVRLAPNGAQVVTETDRFQGTVEYADPTAKASGVVSGKTDVYSFGVTLLELIFGRPEPARLVAWAKQEIFKPDDMQAELRKVYSVALKCLSEYGSRPSMLEVSKMLEK